MGNNIGYFEITADNIDRAKKFYTSLPGWKITPDTTPPPRARQ
jgi:predicted enzyme related to lactoylglutathione lyase